MLNRLYLILPCAFLFIVSHSKATFNLELKEDHRVSSQSLRKSDDCDLLIMENGNEIKVIVKKIGVEKIEYKKCSNKEGPVYVKKKEEVLMIRYSNGEKDMFNDNEEKKKEVSDKEKESSEKSSGLNEGYRGIFELGYLIGKPNRFAINFVNGYQFSPYFSMGGGLGFHLLVNEDDKGVLLYGDFRTFFLDKPVSPYFSLGAGVDLFETISDLAKYGDLDFDETFPYFNPSLGVNIKLANNKSMHICLSYIGTKRYEEKERYLGIKSGISF